MSGSNINSGDDMIRRLETELREKQTFAQEIINRAQNAERDLTDEDKQLLSETRGRMEQLKSQLETVEDVSRITFESLNRARQIGQTIESMKGRTHASPIEYRSAGEYLLDMYRSSTGNRDATERLDMYYREADHQKVADNLGVVPDPILGDVVNFIDAARPVVSLLGPRPLNNATWYRPKVVQHTTVGVQSAEKSELDSQKMTITRLTGTSQTYGGYVNVSRQNIDFSQPQILDMVINDLAAQYAIETEAACCAALAATTMPAISYTADPDATDLAGAIWEAVGYVYNAVRGQGRLVLAVAPDVLGVFGPLFAPVNPVSAQSPGFSAASFGQGAIGNIAGVSVVMSAGLGAGEAFLFSTAAIEVYEQRIGTLQVTEPSVLGLQVAYAGHFAPLVIEESAILPLATSGS